MKQLSSLSVIFLVTLLGLTACSTMPGNNTQPVPVVTTISSRDGAPAFPVDVTHLKNAKPKYEAKCAYGNPSSYTALGKRYYVMESAKGYSKTGVASWYGTKFHGKTTSSREPYNMLAMTAASPTLPIPTYVKVTNLENGKNVIVRVNDRGPFANDRIMDLSYAAAKKLGYAEKGTAHVKVEAITFDGPSSKSVMLASNNTHQATKGKFYLQVGSYQQKVKAQQIKTRVAQLTHQSARIQTVTLNDKTLYRVQVGPLLNNQQKSSLVDQLQQQGFANTIAIMS